MFTRPPSPLLSRMEAAYAGANNTPPAQSPMQPPPVSRPANPGARFPVSPMMAAHGLGPVTPTPMSGGNNSPLPSFAQGGLVGQGGTPIPPTSAPQPQSSGRAGISPQTPSPSEMQRMIAESAQQNPEMIQHIQAAIQELTQNGELTPQELSTVVQLAKAAAANPKMWPQIRNSVISQGIATEEDIPPEFDPGLIAAVLVAGQAIQSQQSAPAPQTGEQPANKPANGKPVIAQVHEGEFVFPQDVVLHYGTDKMNKMIEAARKPKEESTDGSKAQ